MTLGRYDANIFVRKWAEELQIDIKRVMFSVEGDGIHIYTTCPGLWIGKQGNTIHKFSEELKEFCKKWNIPDHQAGIHLKEAEIVSTEKEEDDYFKPRMMLWGYDD